VTQPKGRNEVEKGRLYGKDLNAIKNESQANNEKHTNITREFYTVIFIHLLCM